MALLSSPSRAWDDIVLHGSGEKYSIYNFVYPLIGLCSMTEFIGVFFGKDYSADLFHLALTRSCAVAVSLFGGFFLSTSILEKLGRKFFANQQTIPSMQIFVGHSMVVTLVLDIITGLFSIAVLHWILQLYTLFVVFEGARRYLGIAEKQLTTYTLLATVVILMSPAFIEYLFNTLSVVLN